MSDWVRVEGNTFPVKDALRGLGGRWDAAARCWRVPSAKAGEARALVAGAKAPARCGGVKRAEGWGPLPEGHFELSVGSGYGGAEIALGTVVLARSGYGWSIEHKFPDSRVGETFVVTHCRRNYIREDGMSFGVGDESGYLYHYRLRPASDEEAAAVRAREERNERRRVLSAVLKRTWDHVEREGTYDRPEDGLSYGQAAFAEEIPLVGEARNLYGGGRWLVIEPDRIWAVKNNGMDGDDWSRNNVRTGGAGAIGRWMAYEAPLAEEIRRAAREIETLGPREEVEP